MTDEQFNWLFNKAQELMKKTKDPVHDWSHIERVLVNAEKIKALLPQERVKDLDDKILKIAVAWHDISYIKYKPTLIQYFIEGIRSRKIAKKYFAKINLTNKEQELIGDIILHHTLNDIGILNGRKSIYHQLVQDADHLDSFSHARIKQAEEFFDITLFKRVVMKILKPLFFKFIVNHKKLVYNLPETISRLEKEYDKN